MCELLGLILRDQSAAQKRQNRIFQTWSQWRTLVFGWPPPHNRFDLGLRDWSTDY